MIASLQEPQIFAYALSACMAWVVITDASRYIISNAINGILLAIFIAGCVVLHLAPLPAIGAAAVVLAVGLGLFALGLMGGGDIKLLVVLSLWTGWHEATIQFIFMTAIAGGVLVFIVLILRAVLAPIWLKAAPNKNLPRLLVKKQPIPYGIAIAGAFAWMLWTNMIPGISPA